MALLGSQSVTFWDSPVSTLKKRQSIFWQPGPFPPQPQQQVNRSSWERWWGARETLQPAAQASAPLPKICPMPSPSLLTPPTAHPLASPSDALWIACHQSTTRKRPRVFPKSRWVKSRCCCGRGAAGELLAAQAGTMGGHHSTTAPALRC